MPETRLLSIDLRAQIFGFAILEGPHALLDWGRKRFRNGGTEDNAILLRKKVAALLTFFGPSVIVLKYTCGRNGHEPLKNKELMKAIRYEAKVHSARLVFLTRKDIHQAFRGCGGTSKFKIAGLISKIFSELAWKLPPSRKNWQPEHHNMAIFDAISLGLTYFAQFTQSKVDGER